MAEFRMSIEKLGFTDVATYIQSGNVVFTEHEGLTEAEITEMIRGALVNDHGLAVPVVCRSAQQMLAIVDRHPDGHGPIDPKFLHVMFLDAEPTAVQIASIDPAPYEPDRWQVEGREVYLTYPNGSGRSKVTIQVFEKPFGATATSRNLNTVRKLAALAMDG
jgi:uncharacterized protein (DUF1697 family)